MFDTALSANDLIFLAKGAGMTIFVTLIAVFFGTVLGIVFGIFRYQVGPVIAAPLTFVLDVFRSIPLLIQLVLANAFLGMVLRLGLSGLTVACIVLTLYTSAYCAEIVRGAIESVPQPVRRAARSLGLSWRQDMTNIVLPLAIRVGLPSWIGLSLGVMKDSALVYVVQVTELLKSTQILITRLQEPLLLLMICGAFYFLISFPVARLGGYLEKRWTHD
ncbi:amino acid ABC transporter membrane protein 2, PAAT family [Paracoccus solventivorans]|uniref:Amino acid ABC transporter membrane protein 2, PAAT family n=1 Tax=Paracoccus solventivorans TaxID=53463 RepID=A0A1M7DVK4_9RHOB|nr:amino acid ABC transporter permease [Paracoccus solventivorans]SHL83467.1 amino acid ABC transporter membrane protein 2, PAAT family [Paracoccus solventivorans]HHW32634.1 amino acid ABC transporter permease [Paracoccus solventivorans]HMM10413.1 amino acid ABC transporter permease [Paracoccus solventivorans]